MDKRIPLSNGTTLNFPGMPCTIKEFRGKGSNALVYRAVYEDTLTRGVYHDVLIKELFPLHFGGAVYRDESGQIQVLPDGEDTFHLHKRSFERGNEMHLKLLNRHPDYNGGNIITYPYNGTYYTLLPLNGGKELSDYASQSPSLKKNAQWMLGILESLETFHQSGYLHLDIAPDNIILIPRADREDVLLIDYNSVCGMDEFQTEETVVSSVKDGFSALELQTGEYSLVGCGTDLYSVAAVFFYCLTGRRLQVEEITDAQPPSVADSPALRDVPDTVMSMVRRILTKGLSSLPRRRYKSAADMRSDFQELINRIDLIGVTPWAILEKERARMSELIRQNPFLQYLKDERRLYPLRIQFENELCDLKTFSETVCRAPAPITLLQAEGGMGKTTALELMAIRQNARYSPQETVAVYISAANYRPGQSWFIFDSILEMLRFHPDTGSFQDARHELELLLQKPIQTRSGPKPALLILVDGLNEVGGDSSLLIQELQRIRQMPGAAVIVASRGDVPLADAQTACLMPLEPDDVQDVLQKQGLLTPENEHVRQLLRTPLLLSMYVDSVISGGRQLNIKTADELMERYLDSILKKETARLPEDAPERWQMDAAIRYVLPVIAAATKDGALKDAELLIRVEKCRRVIRSRSMVRVFPQWIGHGRDILGGAKTAEAWYGLMVQRLLWQRFGLLVRDGDGCFRLVHQNIREWLVKRHAPVQKRIHRLNTVRYSFMTALLLALCVGGGWGIKSMLSEPILTPYDDAIEEGVMETATAFYVNYSLLWHDATKMIGAAERGDPDGFNAQYSLYQRSGKDESLFIRVADHLVEQMEASDGEGISYSNLPFDIEAYQQMSGYSTSRREVYDACLPVLRYAAELNAQNDESAADFIAKFRNMVESDAKLAVFLIQRTCIIHWNKKGTLTESEQKLLVEELMAAYREQVLRENPEMQNPIDAGSSKMTLTALKAAAKKAEGAVKNHILMIKYSQTTKG